MYWGVSAKADTLRHWVAVGLCLATLGQVTGVLAASHDSSPESLLGISTRSERHRPRAEALSNDWDSFRERLGDWTHLDEPAIRHAWNLVQTLEAEGDSADLFTAWELLSLLHIEESESALERDGARFARWLGLPRGAAADVVAAAFNARRLAILNPERVLRAGQALPEYPSNLGELALRDEYLRMRRGLRRSGSKSRSSRVSSRGGDRERDRDEDDTLEVSRARRDEEREASRGNDDEDDTDEVVVPRRQRRRLPPRVSSAEPDREASHAERAKAARTPPAHISLPPPAQAARSSTVPLPRPSARPGAQASAGASPPPAATPTPSPTPTPTPTPNPDLDLIRRAVDYYCARPFEATCGGAFRPFLQKLSRVVDNGPVDMDFFKDVKLALSRAIRSDRNATDRQKQALWERIAPVGFEIGNDPRLCDPNRPSAMARPDRGTIYVCRGMAEKAAQIGKAEGKGPRSYLFHILAHELGHYLVGVTSAIAGIQGPIARFTQLFDEAAPDYWADRAIAFWKAWPDALTLMNAARDGLQVLCTMSERSDHPSHPKRAQMIRWLDPGSLVCQARAGTGAGSATAAGNYH